MPYQSLLTFAKDTVVYYCDKTLKIKVTGNKSGNKKD